MAYKIRIATKKQQLKEPDKFVSAVDRLGEAIRERARLLWMLLGVILIIGSGIGAYGLYQRHQETLALVLEFQAGQYYHQEVPDAQEKGSSSKEENYKKAIELYRQLIQNYPKTPAASRAQYYLGNAYLELKDFESAISAYRSFLKKGETGDVLKGLAYQQLGYAYLLKKSSQEALEAFESVQQIKGALNKDLSYYELGRLNESLAQRQEAIKHYQEIGKRFPDSPFLFEAKAHLSALGVVESKPDQAVKPSTEGPPPAEGSLKEGPVEREKPVQSEGK